MFISGSKRANVVPWNFVNKVSAMFERLKK